MKILAALLLYLALPVAAATLDGRVVGVSDGDTITVLDRQKVQHRIRLSGIDAPEKAQPFGNRSKEHLSKWVYNRSVVVEWNKRDRYGRIVGQVLIDGHDACLEQVRAGMAWWYRDYSKEQTPEDRELYEKAESAAKERKLGLWRESNPMPPWEWRQKKAQVDQKSAP
jgi:endonuclease YncB( thermonuclease family)